MKARRRDSTRSVKRFMGNVLRERKNGAVCMLRVYVSLKDERTEGEAASLLDDRFSP